MSITWLDPPVDVTPSGGSTDTWTDLDLSVSPASLPVGTKGVILHIFNNSATDRRGGYRKNGSTDDASGYKGDLKADSHRTEFIGVDADRIIEFNHEVTDGTTEIRVAGYADSDWDFLTNASDYTPGSANTFTDADITPDTTGVAIGAVFVAYAASGNSSVAMALRKNGGSDDRSGARRSHGMGVIGVDSGEVAEVKLNATDDNIVLVGYCTANATFHTNGVDVSLGSTGSTINLSNLPTGATGGFYEVVCPTGTTTYLLQTDGSTENINAGMSNRHGFMIVKAASLVCEMQIADLVNDCFEIGYPVDAAGGPTVPDDTLAPTMQLMESGGYIGAVIR